MKFNFKKISAIVTGALMLGMTMGVASAANYPTPFLETPAIVYGTGSGVSTLDQVYATNVNVDLTARGGTTSSGTSGTATGGDNVLLDRSTDKFNLVNNMSSFYTKLDESELSTVLAKGVYTNDVHDDFDYTQEIVLGADLQLTHFLNSDFNGDKPIIGFDLNSDDLIMNYTLKFTPDDAQGTVSGTWTGITNSYLPLLGEEYYVLTMTNTTTTNHKITLLNAAVSGELAEGESTTLNTDDASYEVSISYIDGTNVKLIVNGETTDSLAASETQKLSDGSYVGVKEVSFQGVTGGLSNVEFSIGSGKLVLENTKEVELNSDKLSDTKYAVENSDETLQHEIKAYINTAGASDLDSIVLQWKIEDDTWIAPGTELTLPGFESIKLSMGDFITDKAEITNLKGDSNTFTLKTTVTDGELDLDILYLNSSSTGIQGLGKDSTEKLVTGNGTAGDTSTPIELNLSEATKEYFVVTWISGDDYETYAYKLGDVDAASNNATILESISGGSDLTIDAVDEFETEGNVKFTLSYAQEKSPTKAQVVLNITAASTGDVYTDRIVTAEGLMIKLPFDTGTSGGDGSLNISGNTSIHRTTWVMNFTEEDKDATIAAGNSFLASLAFSGTDGLEVSTLTPTALDDSETEDNSDKWVGYVLSDLATMTLMDKPTSGLNELDITYHGTQAYAEVYVAEAGVLFTSGTSGSDVAQIGSVVYKDSETSSYADKNVIIVGGSCINSAAAKVLGLSAGTCSAAWTTATGVGAGQYLIQGFASSSVTSKHALLVAGNEVAETQMATEFLTHQTVDTSKKYIGTSATTATVQVEETA